MYPPGSALKIFTAAVGVDTGVATPDTTFRCAGAERVAGSLVKCRKSAGHGELTLRWALADSCNVAFAKLAEQIGPEQFRTYVKRFHLLDMADVPLSSKQGKLADFSAARGDVALVEAGFGQGATLLTPIAMARLAATIASGGEVIQPYLVARVVQSNGRVVREFAGRSLGQAVSPETAARVAGMMQAAVEQGTARVVALRGHSVAAKTGSAENPHGRPHAWMVAYAPADAPRVVVAVVVENGGSGATVAGPIAREMLEELLVD
jgi:peptidoglycan glycosyltransferase